MSKSAAQKLRDAVKAVEALPAEAQDAIVKELEERVADFADGQMSDAQRDEVKRRLASPQRHVPAEMVRALLRRYNPAL
jgi:hypothetical protein